MSAWIDFVKKVAKRDKISYTEALKKASKEYKKKDSTKPATKKKAPAKKASSKSKKEMEMKE